MNLNDLRRELATPRSERAVIVILRRCRKHADRRQQDAHLGRSRPALKHRGIHRRELHVRRARSAQDLDARRRADEIPLRRPQHHPGDSTGALATVRQDHEDGVRDDELDRDDNGNHGIAITIGGGGGGIGFGVGGFISGLSSSADTVGDLRGPSTSVGCVVGDGGAGSAAYSTSHSGRTDSGYGVPTTTTVGPGVGLGVGCNITEAQTFVIPIPLPPDIVNSFRDAVNTLACFIIGCDESGDGRKS